MAEVPEGQSGERAINWLKVHDQDRAPAHWLEIIRPGEYGVFVMNARTRVATDTEGRGFRAGDASVAIASTWEQALRYAGEIVAAHPGLCCEIYDHAGKAEAPLRTVYNPSVRGRYEGLPLAKRDISVGLGLFAAATGFIVYDFLHELRWLWGYVLGLKLVVIGSVFLVRGVAGFCEHRFRRRA